MKTPSLFSLTSALLIATLALAPGAARAETASAASRAESEADSTLTLDDALRLAADNSPALRRSSANVESANARAGQAISPLLPQVSASLGYRKSTSSKDPASNIGSTGDIATFGSGGTDNFGAGVSVHQLIWDFGASWLKSRSAADDAAGVAADARATKNDIAFAVRATFFQAVAAGGVAAIANEAVHNQEEHLAQVQELVTAGLRSPIDEAQVKTNLANARAQAVSAAAAYESARLELGRVIGISGAPLPAGGDAALAFGAVDGEDRPASVVLAAALAARPELTAEDHALQSRQHALEAARTGFFPTLDASVSANTASSSLASLDHFAPSASASINLSWGIFDGFSTMYQVRAAESALNGEQATRDELENQLRADVEGALADVQAARARLAALDSAVENAQALERLAQGRYEVGAGSILELADADLAYVNAAAQRVQADAQLAIARAALLHAEGADA